MSRAQTTMILRVRFLRTHPDDELTQNVNTPSLTNDSKSFPQLHAHDRVTIQAHARATIPVHCSEQPASTVNDLSRCIASSSMHAQRTISHRAGCITVERMQTQRSARMHRVRCMTMQQSACMPIECKDAICTQIERSRQCNEYDASEDNDYLILDEQSRQAKNKASESSQHPK